MLSQAITELKTLLSALRSEEDAPETDYLALQARLFRLTERLTERLQPARGRTAEEEAELCLLLLEAQAETIYSTPAQRKALPRLMTRARRAARHLRSDNPQLRDRLLSACALHEATPCLNRHPSYPSENQPGNNSKISFLQKMNFLP